MKFTDYNSPEKAIINDHFKSIPYMDMWISSIVEGYIYGNFNVAYINEVEEASFTEKYTLRYGEKHGEYKRLYLDGKIKEEGSYYRGKEDGECFGMLFVPRKYYIKAKKENSLK